MTKEREGQSERSAFFDKVERSQKKYQLVEFEKMPVKKQITQTYERYKTGGSPGKSIDKMKSNIGRNQTGKMKTLK